MEGLEEMKLYHEWTPHKLVQLRFTQKYWKKIMIMPLREIDELKNSTEALAAQEPCMSREADLHYQLPWKWN
ncbi:hypothetical protein Pyn_39617 [Prunus yedoensis var. nudiflora]|uniref:Uncharacterized protein n=1 Tax=Prunus yedoensis var. nudiflora TaxID=2094558 RepID=A0A314Z6T6_PRUYE|nr:hypothetical protein Pyn_39617 [Prunus yedoensis var. nudiflora]